MQMQVAARHAEPSTSWTELGALQLVAQAEGNRLECVHHAVWVLRSWGSIVAALLQFWGTAWQGLPVCERER